MSTLTKEWLQQAINDYEGVRDEIPFGLDEYQGNILAALRIALASLKAEPVAYIFKHPAGRLFWSLTDESNKGQSDVMPVYTAPPAPVSVPDAMEMDDDFDSAFEYGQAVGWNAYRAAMLQSFGNSEQLNSPVIPDGWVLVPKEPTPDMLNAAWVSHGIYHASAYRTMLAAAPQQVK